MILILGAVFVILFVFLGGDRGLRSLGALLINVAVFLLDIKALEHGFPAYLVTLITVSLMSVTILFVQKGNACIPRCGDGVYLFPCAFGCAWCQDQRL